MYDSGNKSRIDDYDLQETAKIDGEDDFGKGGENRGAIFGRRDGDEREDTERSGLHDDRRDFEHYLGE